MNDGLAHDVTAAILLKEIFSMKLEEHPAKSAALKSFVKFTLNPPFGE